MRGDAVMAGTRVSFPVESGTLRGYLVQPEGPGPFPAIVVVHEIFGLSDNIRRRGAPNRPEQGRRGRRMGDQVRRGGGEAAYGSAASRDGRRPRALPVMSQLVTRSPVNFSSTSWRQAGDFASSAKGKGPVTKPRLVGARRLSRKRSTPELNRIHHRLLPSDSPRVGASRDGH